MTDRQYQLFSAQYKKFHQGDGVPVQISNGRPKYSLGYDLIYKAPPLYPAWELVKNRNLPVEKFREAYWAGLDKMGVSFLHEMFQMIAEDAGDNRLVLMCFEANKKDCHRGDFGIWWTRNTGELVREL